jgi:hypothetical protein
MRSFVAGLIVALLCAPALAGNNKSDKVNGSSNINVTNKSNGVVAVLINNHTSNADLAKMTKQQFQALGGVFLNKGESHKQHVLTDSNNPDPNTNKNTVKAGYVNTQTGKVSANDIGTAEVSVQAGTTRQVDISGQVGSKASITPH